MTEYIFMDDCPPEDFVDETRTSTAPDSNPMATYLSRLEVKLLETGYCKSQIRKLLKTAGGLGRYLERHGIALADAGTSDLQAYSKSCGRHPSGRRTDRNTGLSTIQSVLKPYG